MECDRNQSHGSNIVIYFKETYRFKKSAPLSDKIYHSQKYITTSALRYQYISGYGCSQQCVIVHRNPWHILHQR